jgi:prepilin-type N-terminal cleavage/methylation domain-containing protein
VPISGRRPSSQHRGAFGFTLVELLTALIVMSVAATVLLKLFTSSQSLAKSSRSHEIAGAVAQEYLTLLQMRPELFVWPNYLDEPPNTPMPVTARDNGPVPMKFTQAPLALPLARRAHDRERATYSGYTWSASARLPSQDAAWVELTVEVQWQLEGRLKRFMLTSAVPRSTAEGVGL